MTETKIVNFFFFLAFTFLFLWFGLALFVVARTVFTQPSCDKAQIYTNCKVKADNCKVKHQPL